MKYIVEYYTLFLRKRPLSHGVYKIKDEKTDTKTEHAVMTQLKNCTTVLNYFEKFFILQLKLDQHVHHL